MFYVGRNWFPDYLSFPSLGRYHFSSNVTIRLWTSFLLVMFWKQCVDGCMKNSCDDFVVTVFSIQINTFSITQLLAPHSTQNQINRFSICSRLFNFIAILVVQQAFYCSSNILYSKKWPFCNELQVYLSSKNNKEFILRPSGLLAPWIPEFYDDDRFRISLIVFFNRDSIFVRVLKCKH